MINTVKILLPQLLISNVWTVQIPKSRNGKSKSTIGSFQTNSFRGSLLGFLSRAFVDMDGTRYLLKVYSVEVSPLPPVSNDQPTIDLQCGTFCDKDAKDLAIQLCNDHPSVNLLTEDDKETRYFFLQEVPVWAMCVMAISSYLLGSAARVPPSRETLKKINRAAKAVEGLALVVHNLAEATASAGNVVGRKPKPETVHKIKTGLKAVAEVAGVIKEMAAVN